MSAKRAFRANLPVFEELYKSVRNGTETRRSLEFNGRKTYREDLQKELTEIDNQEIWRAGKTVRGLRVSRRDLYHPRTDS
jgi:ketol-acid reductoisomerase